MIVFLQCLFILSIVKYSLNAAMTLKVRNIIMYALCAGLWAIMLYPYVIRQTVNVLDQLIANKALMADVAVLTTVEAIVGGLIAFYLLDDCFEVKQKKKKRSLRYQKYLPGIIFPISIIYFELQFFKYRVGADFLHTAVFYSFVVSGCITLLALLFHYLIPKVSTKIELRMLINMGILLIGLLINSAITAYSRSHIEYNVDWIAMISLFTFAVLFVIIGFYLPNIRIYIKNIK